ncbi:hypothetical protein GYMLUDRAFT_461689 [Collybiopsis luxurians FD-317 M1]|uniref:Uncharacterized protein n=1 Tax=Collybiopsis luxurians FD-317 M1 TaxID=944289 RepID=A0A0D0BLS6_9AGAR|nr:hypothetical protein GYMLUDRAFT_461689 [Collybiopsis luxurians FD-317 M1]
MLAFHPSGLLKLLKDSKRLGFDSRTVYQSILRLFLFSIRSLLEILFVCYAEHCLKYFKVIKSPTMKVFRRAI